MSVTTTGIIAAVIGPILAKYGFSDSCSGEISGIVIPLIAALPGVIAAQYGRWRAGGITWYGGRK